MRKLQQVTIVVAAVAGLASFGAGTSFADAPGLQGGSYGPQATAWATSQSAAGATAQGGQYGGAHEHAAPQAVAPQPAPQAAAPQPAPQAMAPQPAPQAMAPQPAPQAVAPQPAPQPAPQAVAPQPAPQAVAAPQPAPQAVAPQPAPQAVAAQPAPQSYSGHHKHKKIDIRQHTQCKSHDMNVNILGQVGLVNGLLGNALNGEGKPGAQGTSQGSRMGCNNVAAKH
ncbi:hypothetical protein [Streptomyces sp. NPDC048650]|uniref:hypothetical protein n=1 Tax=Streptomyces sp. NPDC048650 TaxID=3365583 RepID=UPI00371B0EB0